MRGARIKRRQIVQGIVQIEHVLLKVVRVAARISGGACIAVKQRGALAAATETLGKFFVAAAASATFCNVEINTGDPELYLKPPLAAKRPVEGRTGVKQRAERVRTRTSGSPVRPDGPFSGDAPSLG